MRILVSITKPTEGKVTWNGIDIVEEPNPVRKLLGNLPQDFGVYPNLNGVEFLEYIAAIKGLSGPFARQRVDELLQVVNLAEYRICPLRDYSGGMKQGLGIDQALLNDPQLLIVDEPTAGLDPEARVRFRNLLADLAGERIVILSTHIISDVEASATQIALIRKGKLLKFSTPETLLRTVEGKVWEWIVPSTSLIELRQQYLMSSAIQRGEGVEVGIGSEQCPASDAHVVPPRLEDAYLSFISNNRS
jgi:ABC-type multidrug transport system ATPase subunit